MHRFGLTITVALVLAACSSPTPPADQSATTSPGAPGGEPPVPAHNIGDVETAITLVIRLDPESQDERLEYQELQTKKGDLAMAKLNVSAPHPDSIWLRSYTDMEPRGLRAGDSAFIRQYIFVDTQEEPIAEQSFTWYSESGGRLEPHNLRADVMKYLDPVPNTVLVHSELDIYWLPATEAEDVDPESLPEEPHARKLSNSLRINF